MCRGFSSDRWPLLLIATCVAGCLGRLPPLPPEFASPGVTVNVVSFDRSVVTSMAGSPLASRIMQIAPGRERGGLAVLSERGVRWMDEDGAIVGEMAFAQVQVFRPRLVDRRDGSVAIGGFSRPNNGTVLFDADGNELLRIDQSWNEYRLPVFADVLGDAVSEIIVPERTSVSIFALDGSRLGSVSNGQYTTVETVVQADDDLEFEIAFVKTSITAGPVGVRIFDGDGSLVSEWESPEGGWLSTLDTPDESLFWGLTPEGFVAWDAVGRRVHTFPAGGLTVLRDVVGVAFQDHTVLVASGGGYRNLSVLCVFDAANRLIYQEVLPSRTYAILADSTEAGFYLGADQTVVRYRLAGLGQWESSNTVRGSRGAVRCAGSREAWILWVG